MDENGSGDGVNEFLQRIRELGDKRDREDDERARKLEEEIIAGREARRARRDERARSLSPQKDSPSGTPKSIRSMIFDSSRPGTRDGEDANPLPGESVSDALEKLNGSFTDTAEAAETTSTSRSSGPLSWQRRPKSISVSSKSTSVSPKVDPAQDEEEPEKKRSQIAANLASKDPSWFKQTADRGATSGALRKNHDEEMDIVGKMALSGMLPPGIPASRLPNDPETFSEPEKAPTLSARSSAETLASSSYLNRRDSLRSEHRRLPSSTSVSGGSLHGRNTSLTNNAALRFDPSLIGKDDGFNRPPSMSPSQGRISPERKERTPSPTKGLGGFVQSAMLKREGSINKRWSHTHQPGSLSRQNSANSNRPTYPKSRETNHSNLSRESSPTFDEEADDPIESRGSSPAESISKYTSSGTILSDTPILKSKETTPPVSPSKTFDQKRWSPTKSSWLESALKKGAEGSQPPPPMKPAEKPLVKSVHRSSETLGTPSKSLTSKPPRISPKSSAVAASFPSASTKSLDKLTDAPEQSAPTEKPGTFNKPALSPTKSTTLDGRSFGSKPIPGPKEPLNFRASLKPRVTTDASGNKEELPFLDVMSRLKSTRTQNYVARNELKDNILLGKANLQATGGPQKSKRVDPLKERLVSAKGSLRNSYISSGSSATTNDEVETKPRPALSSKQASAPGRSEEKKGSLAERFNPSLAGLLQKGPAAATSTSGRSSESPASMKPASGSRSELGSGVQESNEGQLTHMTKGRARGPKRRAPNSIASVTGATGSHIQHSTGKENALSPAQKLDKTKPPTPVKSPLLRAESRPNLKDSTSVLLPVGKSTFPSPSIPSSSPRAISREPSKELFNLPSVRDPRSLPLPRPNQEETGSVASVKGAAAAWEKPTENVGPAKSPIKLPTARDEGAARGPGFTVSSGVQEPTARALPSVPAGSSNTMQENSDLDSSRILTEFFNDSSLKTPKMDVDVLSILSSSPSAAAERVKTLHVEVSEITGDGKTKPVSSQQQHILYSENMYLCLHTFETAIGKKSIEVYLWIGDKISEGAAEDAQLFARKTARENDGKLIRLRQGRETATFFQALGGILITRRGSRSKRVSDTPFMLCGRNCLGGLAFDEVDFHGSSLCSGFPYIVSLGGTTLLWKGKGATVQELGVARLVAFELSGGEVKEIDEGNEPSSFLELLGEVGDARPSADYWHLKPSCNKYSSRLFRVDMQSQSKVIELSPFCQSDLEPSEIYVVDAFFELYIVLGAHSQSKRAEFQLALQFTQEYAILAVSVEDRPFIPVSSVIVGGAPREFKVLFRNWENAKIPTSWQPSRKPSLRIVGLNAAIEAMELTE